MAWLTDGKQAGFAFGNGDSQNLDKRREVGDIEIGIVELSTAKVIHSVKFKFS
jgi:hypothetical protein